MTAPTQDQVNAAIRYAGTAAATIFTGIGVLAAVEPQTTAAIATNLHDLADHLTLVVGDLWKLGILVGPIVALWLGKVGYKSASPEAQLSAVVARDDVTKVVVTNQAVADAHGDKVVTP